MRTHYYSESAESKVEIATMHDTHLINAYCKLFDELEDKSRTLTALHKEIKKRDIMEKISANTRVADSNNT